MKSLEQFCSESLRQRAEQDLIRIRPSYSVMQSGKLEIDGATYLSFSSNDYLGLAGHPEIVEAAIASAKKTGMGSGASHVVCGHHDEHTALEEALAEYTGRDRALLFSSGFSANLSVMSAFASTGDYVLQDKLNHASLIDGAKLSGARSQRYLHNDSDSLRRYLAKFSNAAEAESKCLIATDGIFSMDGDAADVPNLANIANEFSAALVVDDAHGLGVFGEQGKGLLNVQGCSQSDVPLLMGTFGKAFGTSGAFVAGPEILIDYLQQSARPYIYTTATPPMLAAATRRALMLVKEADPLRQHLHELIADFRAEVSSLGLDLMPSQSAIQPIVLGSAESVVRLGEFLKAEGILVGVIRPPTVPPNTSRLRITLSAAHSFADVERLVVTLKAAKARGIIPTGGDCS